MRVDNGGSQPAIDRRFASVLVRWLSIGSALGLVALAVVVNQSAIHWRDDLNDSHLFSYYGWCIVQGARPYLDFWDNKPPGVFWANAAATAAVGRVDLAEIVACSAAMIGTLLAGWAALQTFYRGALGVIGAGIAALVLTHVEFECGSNRTETWVLFFELAAVAGYGGWLWKGQRRWLLLGALAAGAAPWFKQVGMSAGLVCLVHLLCCAALRAARGSRRAGSFGAVRGVPWVAVVIVALLPSLLAGGALAAQGSLGEAWYAIVTVNRFYFDVGDAGWWRLGEALRLFWPELVPLTGLLVLAICGAAIDLWQIARRRGRSIGDGGDVVFPPTAMLWAWLLLTGYLACVGPGRQAHHLMPLLGPLMLLAARPLAAMGGGGTVSARIVAHPSAAALLVVFFAVLADVQASSLRCAASAWRQKQSWLGLERRELLPVQLQAAAAVERCPPGERLYVWGWHPGVYRYSERLPAAKFENLHKVYPLRPYLDSMPAAVMTRLESKPPAVIVVSEFDLGWMTQEPRHRLAVLLESRYEKGPIIDGWVVFSRQE